MTSAEFNLLSIIYSRFNGEQHSQTGSQFVTIKISKFSESKQNSKKVKKFEESEKQLFDG